MRFVTFFFLTLGLALACIAALNWIVNPYALYPSQAFPPVSANDLERSLREIEAPTFAPELVVLGSSRSARMGIRELSCYSGLVSANQAYAGASPVGYYALTRYMLAN